MVTGVQTCALPISTHDCVRGRSKTLDLSDPPAAHGRDAAVPAQGQGEKDPEQISQRYGITPQGKGYAEEQDKKERRTPDGRDGKANATFC